LYAGGELTFVSLAVTSQESKVIGVPRLTDGPAQPVSMAG